MIANFNTKNRKDDARILTIIIVGFLFVVWLCTPPGNKFAQMCFYGNKTQFFIAKMTKPASDLNEWLFHRNNAIYLTQMERKAPALKEMDEAIKTAPSYINENEMMNLYADRANLRLYWGEYKGALDDYLRVKDPNIVDKFKIALLYKKAGNNRYALSYCNSILNTDPNAYIGYACMADVYAGVGKFDTSVKVYDLLIDRTQNRAQYYADRAFYRKKCGDYSGYLADINKAKELAPTVDKEITIIKDTLKPKRLLLAVM